MRLGMVLAGCDIFAMVEDSDQVSTRSCAIVITTVYNVSVNIYVDG